MSKNLLTSSSTHSCACNGFFWSVVSCSCFLVCVSSLFCFCHQYLHFSPSFFQLGSNSSPSLRFSIATVIMDHAQGRAFRHRLARAIMHLNYLAGLLPFFEPSIEWDDPTPDHQFRTGRPNPASRSLHTFVPLPASSNPPTMVSHGGIPSHMVLNPEPNLRPLRMASYSREEEGHNPSIDVTTRTPVPSGGHASTTPPDNPQWTTPAPGLPRATTRITTPVPVRSKQRSTPTEDPQPKKKQRSTSGPDSTSRPPFLPYHFRDPTHRFQFG